jgi:hypothetical protein
LVSFLIIEGVVVLFLFFFIIAFPFGRIGIFDAGGGRRGSLDPLPDAKLGVSEHAG